MPDIVSIRADPLMTWANRAFLARAVLLVLMGIGLGIAGLFGWNEYLSSTDPMPMVFYVLWPLALCSMGLVPGAVSVGVAVGLSRGSRVAWYLGVVLGALDALSCFLPFGVLALWALLRVPVRRWYLG